MGIWCRTDQELQGYLRGERAKGHKIVTTNGCFDIVHSGHVKMLREAADQGDILVVGINSDASIRKLKGPNRPIRSEEERVEIINAFEMVDYTILFEERDCMDFIQRVRPDVHVNDASYGENCIEAETVRSVGARLHLAPKFPCESSTALLERIRRLG